MHRFAELMNVTAMEDASIAEAGELMFASHESYKVCGLTEPRTDSIVERARDSRDKGLFGARITGGGSGGTVVVLARRGSRNAIDELADQLAGGHGERPYLFHGSSPGCSMVRPLILRCETSRKVAE